eukprot:scpid86820/ scgid30927/ 
MFVTIICVSQANRLLNFHEGAVLCTSASWQMTTTLRNLLSPEAAPLIQETQCDMLLYSCGGFPTLMENTMYGGCAQTIVLCKLVQRRATCHPMLEHSHSFSARYRRSHASVSFLPTSTNQRVQLSESALVNSVGLSPFPVLVIRKIDAFLSLQSPRTFLSQRPPEIATTATVKVAWSTSTKPNIKPKEN